MNQFIKRVIRIPNIYVPNNKSLKYMKQKLIVLQGETEKLKIVVGNINTLLPITVRSHRHKRYKRLEHHNHPTWSNWQIWNILPNKNLRYVDDTTLMAESVEELKNLSMKVKEESEKAGLQLNIQKTMIMASGPITSWEIDGEIVETVSDLILGGSKITADGDYSHVNVMAWN